MLVYQRVITVYNWLVVLIILKNMSQWKGLSHILWKIKMFETTNQIISAIGLQPSCQMACFFPGAKQGNSSHKCVFFDPHIAIRGLPVP